MAKECDFKELEVARFETGLNICNIEDTSDETPPTEDNGSWTAFWERITNKPRPSACPVCGAKMDAEKAAGSHVRLKSSPQDEWGWITILCDSCNNWQNKKAMTIATDISAVRIKMSKKRKSAL